MDQSIDGGSGRHRILEDSIPLGADQIARDRNAAALIALAEEGEEHLHLVAVLLDVSDVINDDQIEGVEPPQRLLEQQVSLRHQEPLDELVGRTKQNAVASLDQFVSDGAQKMCLAASWCYVAYPMTV